MRRQWSQPDAAMTLMSRLAALVRVQSGSYLYAKRPARTMRRLEA